MMPPYFKKITNFIVKIALFLVLNSVIITKTNATTLDEAINLGLNNSKTYKIEKYYLKSAQNNKNNAISEFLPDISLSYQNGRKQNIRSDGAGTQDFLVERSNTLSFTQPIFDGMRGVAALKQGESQFLAQKFKLENFKRELTLKIINNYFENLKLRQIKQLVAKNVKNYQLILAKIASKSLLVSENDIIDSKIGYYNAKKYLEEVKNNLKQAEIEYEILTGQKADNLIELEAKLKPLILENILQNKALNPSLIQKGHEVKAYKQAYKKEIGNLSPKVNLSANYSKQQNLVYLDGGDLENKSVFIEVKIPLFQKGVEYFGIKKAKYDLEIKKEEQQLTLLEVEKNIKQSFSQYDYAKKNYDQIKKLFNLSKAKLYRNYKSYNIKAISLIDLLRIKITRNEAAIKFYEAKANLYQSYYKLLLITQDYQSNF